MQNIILNSLTIFWSGNNHQEKWLVFCFHCHLFYGRKNITLVGFISWLYEWHFPFSKGWQVTHKVIKDVSKLIKRTERRAANEIKYWFFFGSHVSPSAFLYCYFLAYQFYISWNALPLVSNQHPSKKTFLSLKETISWYQHIVLN